MIIFVYLFLKSFLSSTKIYYGTFCYSNQLKDTDYCRKKCSGGEKKVVGSFNQYFGDAQQREEQKGADETWGKEKKDVKARGKGTGDAWRREAGDGKFGGIQFVLLTQRDI